MNTAHKQVLRGFLSIDGKVVGGERIEVAVKSGEISFTFGHAHIHLEAPPELTLARTGADQTFTAEAQKLGLYADVADFREGPYVNHFINKLEIAVRYQDDGIFMRIYGEADLSESSVDTYWYHGKVNGSWSFTTEFLYPYGS